MRAVAGGHAGGGADFPRHRGPGARQRCRSARLQPLAGRTRADRCAHHAACRCGGAGHGTVGARRCTVRSPPHGPPATWRLKTSFRRALVLLADHELNPSTYALRCAVSTGLNLYDAMVAGLIALKGPRHGGAGSLAAHMVTELAEADLAARVRERAALGETVPGFGHSVYKSWRSRARRTCWRHSRAPDPTCGWRWRHLRWSARRRGSIPTSTTRSPCWSAGWGFRRATSWRCSPWRARPAGWRMAWSSCSRGRLIRPRARYTGPAPARGA